MPRGDNPNSRANLRRPSSKEARKNGKKGGIASGEARAVYRSLQEDLREQATPERIAKINNRLLSMAEHGNLKAYELVRDGLGEKPKDAAYEEEQRLRTEKLRMETERLRREADQDEAPDDGFLEALAGTAAEDWDEDG